MRHYNKQYEIFPTNILMSEAPNWKLRSLPTNLVYIGSMWHDSNCHRATMEM